MRLPVSQRRILGKMENAIQISDPRLTSLFNLFSRLSRDEEMPRVEQLPACARPLPAILVRRLAAGSRLRRGPFASIRQCWSVR